MEVFVAFAPLSTSSSVATLRGLLGLEGLHLVDRRDLPVLAHFVSESYPFLSSESGTCLQTFFERLSQNSTALLVLNGVTRVCIRVINRYYPIRFVTSSPIFSSTHKDISNALFLLLVKLVEANEFESVPYLLRGYSWRDLISFAHWCGMLCILYH